MINAKTASLTVLCIHYATLTLTIHASRAKIQSDDRYKASSAVCLTEAGKFLLSFVLALRDLHQQQRAHASAAVSEYQTPAFDYPETFQGQLPSGVGLGIVQEEGEYEKSPPKSRRRAASEVDSHLRHSHSRSTSLQLVPSSPTVSINPTRSSRNGFLAHQTEQHDSPNHQLLSIHTDDTTIPDSCSRPSAIKALLRQVFGPKFYKIALPAFLFALQGNLQYLAVSNLSVPTFQVTSQLKILTTALCSVLLLNRHLTTLQWCSLFILASGAGIVQLQSFRENHSPPLQISNGSSNSTTGALDTFSLPSSLPSTNALLGLIAVSLMSLSSGFASTYFEKVLKSLPSPVLQSLPFATPHEEPRDSVYDPLLKESYSRPPELTPIEIVPALQPTPQEPVGLWIRNVQLSMFGLLLSSLMFLLESNKEAMVVWIGFEQTGEELMHWNGLVGWQELTGGFLQGFTPIVWFVVALQIVGGLLAALVMKYADNIQKNFALALSIILSFAISILFFDFQLSAEVIIGGALVIGATFLFNSRNQDIRSLIGWTSPRC